MAGMSRLNLPPSLMTMQSHASRSACCGDELLQPVAAHLFLALDDVFQVDRQAAAGLIQASALLTWVSIWPLSSWRPGRRCCPPAAPARTAAKSTFPTGRAAARRNGRRPAPSGRRPPAATRRTPADGPPVGSSRPKPRRRNWSATQAAARCMSACRSGSALTLAIRRNSHNSSSNRGASAARYSSIVAMRFTYLRNCIFPPAAPTV